jgi:hypothetical protein
MRPVRFPIVALLALVAFVAAAVASLRDGGSRPWDGAWLSALLLSLTLSVLLAVHRRGETRAFWLGFALFGWVYLGLVQLDLIRSRLPTSWALSTLSRVVTHDSIDLATATAEEQARFLNPNGGTREGVVLGFAPGHGQLIATRGGLSGSFYLTGHSLWAFLMAFAGGLASRGLHREDPPPSAPMGPSAP